MPMSKWPVKSCAVKYRNSYFVMPPNARPPLPFPPLLPSLLLFPPTPPHPASDLGTSSSSSSIPESAPSSSEPSLAAAEEGKSSADVSSTLQAPLLGASSSSSPSSSPSPPPKPWWQVADWRVISELSIVWLCYVALQETKQGTAQCSAAFWVLTLTQVRGWMHWRGHWHCLPVCAVSPQRT